MKTNKKYRKWIIAALINLLLIGLLILFGFNLYSLNKNQQKLSNVQTKYSMLKDSYDGMNTNDVTYQENLTYQNMKTIAKTNNDSLTDSMKIIFGNYPTVAKNEAAVTKLTKNYMTKADAQALIGSVNHYTRLHDIKIYNYSDEMSQKEHYYYSNVTVTYYERRGNHLHTNHYLFKVTLNHQDLNSDKIWFHLIRSFRGDRHAR
ncbi:hypothetical protein BGL34_03630 [Fructilactobacillus lindneri]|uniref:Uncharacterized protein n=1 Tax=Fructilactobacillus lindneri DSM 20690 = JCM 11027 TaxID=1122148 RepID=A0A0R2JX07_9LACO|nr:hypothetical protein [Fructilactobacillus lindneri]KRN78772.1 hypothetical protein IV52_GL001051 [Fructilactobacillus lindneri DSM 20690 = JCM 11027]POH06423.1 hypothetical protein BGL35_03425 [Fructilactobacillus lindneri]POH06978.1 hypothetical protein BGL34_03630 [Fructilactobacillus lindneri]POH23963.1 hypothetical protein BHU33_03425 [Fructilactobacillus lindneri DSM 20690 = JCM 11027]SJZ86799.1 hypothetical protein SAMN02746042_00612 [Fructilactobacillus lindneri DSM 20690 = JCM 11027